MEKLNITIVGAGVVGLSIASELSKVYQDILVVERNPTFGQETSSRNSEVIHAGIYYPRDSLKAKTCVEGKKLIYAFCKENNIAHKRIGKFIVALDKTEIEDLERLCKQGLENGVNDLEIISAQQIQTIEPNVRAYAAIHSPSTGILDSHSFMKNFILQFEMRAGLLAYNTELVSIEKAKGGYQLTVQDKRKGGFKFFTRLLINSAGLNSDRVAQMVGIRGEEYKLKYCKGSYFRIRNNKAGLIHRLIYPVPKKNRSGLGIHATLDLAGGLRLGPDDEYVDRIDYNVDEAKKIIFYESVRSFLPFIKLEDMFVDTSGIRPKLQGLNEGFRDFIIREEAEHGYSGFINLIGIESPGLTSSLSIARIVKEMVYTCGFCSA